MRLAHYLIIESNSNHHIPNMRFFNALTARSTDTLKVFAFVGRDVKCIGDIQLLIAHAERNPRTLNAFCASIIIQPLQRLHSLQGFTKEFLPNITKKTGNI